MHHTFTRLGLSALILLATACGGDDDNGASDAGTGGQTGEDGGSLSVDYSKGPLLPLTIGSHWTYRVTDGDKIEEKTLTAEDVELVGGDGVHAGEMATKLVADRGKELTYSWVVAQGDKVVRLREQVLDADTMEVKTEDSWDPSRLYVDGSAEHRVQGADWLEQHSEVSTKDGVSTPTDVRERWTVVSAAEQITVPAGTFTAVVFQKAGVTKLKQYWYVPGIGKIKETGGQVEELSDYDIAK